ncbi:hypothetical protein CGCF413_v013463 [Colletotrichum fructicola]|nr:hypothetical protein CGCF413_v013463 [Colletotrichum fructicola]
MKCDETWPRCANCVTVGRRCVFPLSADPDLLSTPMRRDENLAGSSGATTPNADTSSGSPSGRSPAVISAPDLTHLTNGDNIFGQLESDVAINMVHMKLLIHFSLRMAIPELDEHLIELGTRLTVKTGAEVPYLLHEALSLSARHLSMTVSEKSSEYLNLAVQLQNRAILLFNSEKVRVDETTCVPMILFSSILGRHLCMDALAFRSADLGPFLDCYVNFVRVHRGVKVIVNRGWPLLKDSELCPLVAWGMGLGRLRSRGHDCDDILRLLDSYEDISPDCLEACHRAIEFVQIAVDDLQVRMFTRGKHLYQIVFSWSLLVPEAFSEMLVQRKPVAIAILAHYAALLHLARDLWQIGDSGAYLLNVISKYLGSEWDEWLAWPRSIVLSEDMEVDIPLRPSIPV